MCEKALASAADSVIFDLEDAVSSSMKQEARNIVCGLLQKMQNSSGCPKEVIVRVNPVSTLTGVEDVMALTRFHVNALIVPKICLNDAIAADVLLSGIEQSLKMQNGSIRLIGLIETTLGLEQISELPRAVKRLDGFQLGAEDLTKELEITRTAEGAEIAYARHRMVVASRAYNLDAIDTPFADFKNTSGLKADIATCRQIGMQAKTAIHPCQVDVINEAFTPTEAEILQAQRIIDAYENSVSNNLGACSLDGKMIDVPIADKARKLVEKGKVFSR